MPDVCADIITSRAAPPEREPRRWHLIGACGAGMRALAEWLRGQGVRVSGSDLKVRGPAASALRRRGVQLHEGHAAEHLPADCEQVIYSAAVPSENCERRAAEARGMLVKSYPQLLSELTRQRDAVCVAGTHGKSTTCGLIGSILASAGPCSDLICGAELLGTGSAGWSGDGRRLVVESCEFRRHFLQLVPHTLVVTGIEWDHVDCFGSLNDTVDAFAALMRRVREDGTIIYQADCRAARRAVSAARMDRRCTGPRVMSCGVASDADWRIVSHISRAAGGVIELAGPDEELLRLEIPLPGAHNATNAALAAVSALVLGASASETAAAIASFAGVRRRLEYIGDWRGMTLIDDYAHHPTAVQAVLSSVRTSYPGRRVLVVFEPHQVQRTEIFLPQFATALAAADRAWVLPACAAREPEGDRSRAISQKLADEIRSRGERGSLLPSLDRVWDTLETEGRPGDIVLLMGAGTIERIADEFSVRLRRHHAG